MQPSSIVFDVASGLSAMAAMLRDIENLNQVQAQGLGVICDLLRVRLEDVGATLLDDFCQPRVAA